MPPEWKLPTTKCHLSSNGQDKKQARKSLFRTNRRTMETKKLRTQIFIQQQKICSTALSKYVWDCKDKIKQTPEISWKIVKSAPAYTNTSKRCVLCLEEKMAIITYPDQEKLLNKGSELISKCRHENKFLLKYYDSND